MSELELKMPLLPIHVQQSQISRLESVSSDNDSSESDFSENNSEIQSIHCFICKCCISTETIIQDVNEVKIQYGLALIINIEKGKCINVTFHLWPFDAWILHQRMAKKWLLYMFFFHFSYYVYKLNFKVEEVVNLMSEIL